MIASEYLIKCHAIETDGEKLINFYLPFNKWDVNKQDTHTVQ